MKLYGIATGCLPSSGPHSTGTLRLASPFAGTGCNRKPLSALGLAAPVCLVYVAISFRALSIAELGVFLFAMLRLAPRLSSLSSTIYAIEGELPHLVRTHQFIDRLEAQQESTGGQSVPDALWFRVRERLYAYEDEPALRIIDGRRPRAVVGIVGKSGGGKSTVVSLLTRLYRRISVRRTNGTHFGLAHKDGRGAGSKRSATTS